MMSMGVEEANRYGIYDVWIIIDDVYHIYLLYREDGIIAFRNLYKPIAIMLLY